MDRFGEHWREHPRAIEQHWREVVHAEDLVLVTGDISWAMRLPQAAPDLEFLASLPGHKVLLKGNHDYWWASRRKVEQALPEGFSVVQASAIRHGPVVLAGTRLWDVPGVSFASLIDWQPGPGGSISAVRSTEDEAEAVRIYQRELARLDRALQEMQVELQQGPAALRIVLTHYPPCGADLAENEVTRRIEAAGADHVVFGHLHALRTDLEQPPFGRRGSVTYHLASADYVGFRPILIAEVP